MSLTGGIDRSQLLGLDAVMSAVAEVWGAVVGAWAPYAPNLLLGLLAVAVYALLYLGLRALLTLIVRPTVRDPHRAELYGHLGRVGLRLTVFMLAVVSVLTLLPPLADWAAVAFRVYLLALLLLLGWALTRYLLRRQGERWGLDASLGLLLHNLLWLLWLTLGIYLVFAQVGINLLPILGGLGVVGLAVGFAAQDVLANFISGVTLLLDRPFRIGDWIRTNDREGQVTGLTLRTTRIRTRDNETISIPNKELAGSVVVNLSEGGPLRVNVPVGVAYRTEVPQAREVLLAVLRDHPRVMKDRPTVVLVGELNDSSVDLLMRFWVSQQDIATYPVTAMELREGAKAALQDAGIEIPFPHLQVHIDSAAGLQELLPALLEGSQRLPSERQA